jgi:putative GTP pyrophosphokinase
MTETEFLTRWHAEKTFYESWGRYVKSKIEESLLVDSPSLDLESFLKIAKPPRSKKDESLLDKAFHRDKNYEDPYLEIEDKIGLRFVVLLTTDITKLQAVVEKSEQWSASLDKDYESEREARPTEFAYQSKHYVLKASRELHLDGVTIPAGTPCEVQLRTLLQHAHSELTHDNIYKVEAGNVVSTKVHRTVAKSMALIEAVDDYFELAIEQLSEATAPERRALKELTFLYEKYIGRQPGLAKSNRLVLNAFPQFVDAELSGKIEKLLSDLPFIATNIRDRYDSQHSFRQPWMLLAYLAAMKAPEKTQEDWPLTPEEIKPVYVDLGKKWS